MLASGRCRRRWRRHVLERPDVVSQALLPDRAIEVVAVDLIREHGVDRRAARFQVKVVANCINEQWICIDVVSTETLAGKQVLFR